MPFVDNHGVRIHYESDGHGPPLVLQHGFLQSLQRWFDCGYVAALRAHYRVVLVDARGHGGSDKPHDRTAYAWPVGVSDVVAVLDALAIEQAHYWGYSMGGAIGLGLVMLAPERVRSLVVGGASADAMNVGTAFRHIDGSDGEAFVAAFEALIAAPLAPAFRASVLAGDTRAFAAAAQDRPSLLDRLDAIVAPCLAYAGDRDFVFARARDTAGRIPGATFMSLPGLNHPQAFIRSDLVLPRVLEFLARVEASRPGPGAPAARGEGEL